MIGAVGPAGVIAPGTVVDVVFVNDGVTVVNGVRTEDRKLIVESISVGGATPMLPTASGVTVDQGDGMAAFDGVSTLPGQTGLWWNAALRFTVPAANIGSAPTLKVRARATLAGGIGAKMVVRVGGAIIGTVDVNNVGTAADYSFALPGATPPPAVPTGTGVDVVFTNDGVTVVNGARTEDRNLIIESLSVGGGTPMLPTASGVTVDQGDGAAAFDGIDTLPGQGGLWWNAALRLAVPAANIGTGSTLIVRAKATLAGGIGANMVVRVGGVVIGSATVSNTAAYADYSFPIPGAGGGSGATATGWSYDANSLSVAIVQKSGGLETGRWTLGYNGSGDVVNIQDVAGASSATLTNDASGRITQVSASNGATAGFSANARGRMAQAVTPSGTVTYVYDARNLPAEIRFSDGRWVRFSYSASHKLVGITDSAGRNEHVAAVQAQSTPESVGRAVFAFGRDSAEWTVARLAALLPSAHAAMGPEVSSGVYGVLLVEPQSQRGWSVGAALTMFSQDVSKERAVLSLRAVTTVAVGTPVLASDVGPSATMASTPEPDPQLCFSDCAVERRACAALCARAKFDPGMPNIFNKSIRSCMKGCLPARCGGY